MATVFRLLWRKLGASTSVVVRVCEQGQRERGTRDREGVGHDRVVKLVLASTVDGRTTERQ